LGEAAGSAVLHGMTRGESGAELSRRDLANIRETIARGARRRR